MDYSLGEVMGDSIPDIYAAFCKANPSLLKFHPVLVGGGLVDVKGPGTSDVDVAVCWPDPTEVTFDELPRKVDFRHHRIIYTFYYARDINVYVTKIRSRVENPRRHRLAYELLARCAPTLAMVATFFKKSGDQTDHAWGKALDLSDDVQTWLTGPLDKLEEFARQKELVFRETWQRVQSHFPKV